jgi:hypothetical protein
MTEERTKETVNNVHKASKMPESSSLNDFYTNDKAIQLVSTDKFSYEYTVLTEEI